MQTIALSKKDILKLVAVIGVAPLAITVLGFTATVALLSSNNPVNDAEPESTVIERASETEARQLETLTLAEEDNANVPTLTLLEPVAEPVAEPLEVLESPAPTAEEPTQAQAKETADPAEISEPISTAAQSAPSDRFTIQLGFFSNGENALNRAEQLRSKGLPIETTKVTANDGSTGTALLSGHFDSKTAAEKKQASLERDFSIKGWVQPLARYEALPLMAMH